MEYGDSTVSRAPREVLDACCGSRMMWFDKTNPKAIFGDRRRLVTNLCDGRSLRVTPEVMFDFRHLPFADNTFRLVVFDPPHLERAGPQGWMRAKYGALDGDWRHDLQLGFSECFRVLKRDSGVLIFKWCEEQVALSEVLKLTPHSPLFGHRTGRKGLTHWLTFMSEAQKGA